MRHTDEILVETAPADLNYCIFIIGCMADTANCSYGPVESLPNISSRL